MTLPAIPVKEVWEFKHFLAIPNLEVEVALPCDGCTDSYRYRGVATYDRGVVAIASALA